MADNLKDDMREYIDNFAVNLIEDLASFGLEVGKTQTPVRDGPLRESLRILKRGKFQRDLVWGGVKRSGVFVNYAIFVALGTKPHEIVPKKPGGVLVFNIGDKKIFTKKVKHPGTKANPYDIRTLAEILNRIDTKYGN